MFERNKKKETRSQSRQDYYLSLHHRARDRVTLICDRQTSKSSKWERGSLLHSCFELRAIREFMWIIDGVNIIISFKSSPSLSLILILHWSYNNSYKRHSIRILFVESVVIFKHLSFSLLILMSVALSCSWPQMIMKVYTQEMLTTTTSSAAGFETRKEVDNHFPCIDRKTIVCLFPLLVSLSIEFWVLHPSFIVIIKFGQSTQERNSLSWKE